ncbi:MAG TPA: PIN domain-containing protein [Verrucomicrobiae bacterium]
MKYLLDNNVLSEWWKPKPDSRVAEWVESADWYIPAPVIAEIQEGAESNPSESRKVQINAKLDEFMRAFSGLVVDWDAETARIWGRLKHSPEVKRKPQPLWDSLIDAMAVRYDYIIATRNSADFRHAKIFDPWLKRHSKSPGT